MSCQYDYFRWRPRSARWQCNTHFRELQHDRSVHSPNRGDQGQLQECQTQTTFTAGTGRVPVLRCHPGGERRTSDSRMGRPRYADNKYKLWQLYNFSISIILAFSLLLTMWWEFACSAIQHMKSKIKKKNTTYLCTPCELLKQCLPCFIIINTILLFCL